MLGSSRLTAYHIFAISRFNVLILFFLLTEREVVDSKPHHHEKNALTKAKIGFQLNKGISKKFDITNNFPLYPK